MPTDELGPQLVRLLRDQYGDPPARSRPDDPWLSLLLAFLDHEVPSGRGPAFHQAVVDADLSTPDELAQADPTELADIARQAAAKPTAQTLALLRRLASWATGLDADDWENTPTEALRDDLRSLRGLGPGLVDTLLLRGLGRPSPPVQAPAYRILARHGWIDPSAGYDEAQSVLLSLAPDDLDALPDWLARLSRDFCKPAVPRCQTCPLRPLLPPSGPIEPDS